MTAPSRTKSSCENYQVDHGRFYREEIARGAGSEDSASKHDVGTTIKQGTDAAEKIGGADGAICEVNLHLINLFIFLCCCTHSLNVQSTRIPNGSFAIESNRLNTTHYNGAQIGKNFPVSDTAKKPII